MPIFPYLLGILGLIVGSFLNVVILRRTKDEGIGGRSACPVCKTTLKWYELVPVISFLIQTGKCRTCNHKISFQYIFVEILTGVVFWSVGSFLINSLGFMFLTSSFVVATLGLLSVCSFAISIIVFDIQTKNVPLNWFIGMLISSIFYLLGAYSFHLLTGDVLAHAIGMLIAVPFLILWAFSNGRLIGFADIEIIAWIGLFFGAMFGVSAVLIAFYTGALFSILFVVYKIIKGFKYKDIRTMQIPFTPFLIIAWFGTLVFSWNIFSLFTRLFI